MRRSPSRSTALALTLTLAACVAGCVSSDEGADLPFKAIEPLTTGRVEVLGSGLAERIRYTTRIEPTTEMPLTVVGLRPESDIGDDAVLDITVRVVDFPGTGPISQGFSMHAVGAYGPGGVAAAGAPLEQSTEVELRPAQPVLARRVEAFARLFVIDLQAEDGRSGNMMLTFPVATAESLVRPPTRSLLEALGGEDPAELFLAAAAMSGEQRDTAISQLIDGLSYASPSIREAIYGALLYLTGETHGRSEYRWRDWWRLQRES